MKVTIDTPDVLRLDYTPWGLGLGLIAFLLVWVGTGIAQILAGNAWNGLIALVLGGGLSVVALIAFSERTQVWADRGAGTVALRRRTLMGRSERVHALGDVVRAEVESAASGQGRSTSRPVLRLVSGATEPLRRTYASGQGAAATAAAINRWLGVGAGAVMA